MGWRTYRGGRRSASKRWMTRSHDWAVSAVAAAARRRRRRAVSRASWAAAAMSDSGWPQGAASPFSPWRTNCRAAA